MYIEANPNSRTEKESTWNSGCFLFGYKLLRSEELSPKLRMYFQVKKVVTC